MSARSPIYHAFGRSAADGGPLRVDLLDHGDREPADRVGDLERDRASRNDERNRRHDARIGDSATLVHGGITTLP